MSIYLQGCLTFTLCGWRGSKRVQNDLTNPWMQHRKWDQSLFTPRSNLCFNDRNYKTIIYVHLYIWVFCLQMMSCPGIEYICFLCGCSVWKHISRKRFLLSVITRPSTPRIFQLECLCLSLIYTEADRGPWPLSLLGLGFADLLHHAVQHLGAQPFPNGWTWWGLSFPKRPVPCPLVFTTPIYTPKVRIPN